MNMHASVRGGPELAAKLRRLSDEMAGASLEHAVTAGALLVVNAAQKKAPWITGNLRRSIHVGGHVTESRKANPETMTKTTGTDIGGNTNSRTRATVAVGTNVIYGAIQEFGGIIRAKNAPFLVFRTKDGRWHRTKSVQIPAHPYLRPALDENKGAVVREIGEALHDLLRRVR